MSREAGKVAAIVLRSFRGAPLSLQQLSHAAGC